MAPGPVLGAQRRKISNRKTWIRAKLCLNTGHHIPLRFFNSLCDYILFFRLEGPSPLDYKGILGVQDRVFGLKRHQFWPKKGAQPRKIAYLNVGSADAQNSRILARFGDDAKSRPDPTFTRASPG